MAPTQDIVLQLMLEPPHAQLTRGHHCIKLPAGRSQIQEMQLNQAQLCKPVCCVVLPWIMWAGL